MNNFSKNNISKNRENEEGKRVRKKSRKNETEEEGKRRERDKRRMKNY